MAFCTVGVKGAFISPQLLLARAKEHIADLERCVSAALSPDRWTLLSKVDPHTGDQIFKIRLGDSITTRASVIALDVVSNLRSALDHAVYASSVALFGGESKNAISYGFDDEKVFKVSSKGCLVIRQKLLPKEE